MARIILADDDPVIGGIVATALIDSGHALGWVDSGDKALRIMRARPPHLAIIDCGLPGLPGIELLRSMRGDGALCAIPVLILTARRSENDEALAYLAGAHDYLRKPADLDQLVARVEALLSPIDKASASAVPIRRTC